MTALQELINEFNEIKNFDYYRQILILRAKAHRLLELEKQQIIDALHYFGIEGAGEYYEKTFNQPK
jgi:hypothetical protein